MACAEELSYLLRKVGLDAEYWKGILKTELNITLPQQIQHLDGSHLQLLKNFITKDWEQSALEKFLPTNDKPLPNHTENDGKSDLASKLTAEGLDVEYWSGVLNTKLGITRIEQTTNLQAEDLWKLKNAIRQSWELKALQKIFGISEKDYEVFLSKVQEQYKLQLDEAKKLVQNLKELNQKAVHHSDDMIKSKEDQIKKLMNVDNELCIKHYDDKSLEELISKLNTDLQNLTKSVEDRPTNNASEIMETASGGLALRGILVGKDFCDDWVKRIVLSAPTEVKLINPIMLQVEDIVHFSSKAQSDHFHRTLDTVGQKLATILRAGGWGFHAEPGFSKNNEREDKIETEYHSHTNFESRVIYSFVPIAACQLNPLNLRLSQEALRELKTIDTLLVGGKSSQLLWKTCEEFLMSYGSHVNAGILHFGGVSKFIATYTSEIESESGKTISMVQDSLSAYASASVSHFRFSAGLSLRADCMKISGGLTADYEKSERAKVCLHTSRNGGPQEVSNLSLWKKGLVTHNSTWALIDRGKTLFRDFIGIWQLILNHKGEFKLPTELSTFLRTVWVKMSGYIGSGGQIQSIINSIDVMDQLVDMIGKWNSQPLEPERCIKYLHEVLKSVEQVSVQTKTTKYWEDRLCSEENVRRFLENIVEVKETFLPKHKSMLQFLIRKLVAPCSKEFPGKQKILEWAEVNAELGDIPSILYYEILKTVPDLIRNIKERFLPALTVNHAQNVAGNVQIRDRINAGATVDMALCVGQLLENLQSSGRSHEVFFLEVALLSLHYHWQEMTFDTLIGLEELQRFVTDIESLWKGYQDHNEKGMLQLEAFLIYTLLTYGHFDEGHEALELEFTEIIKDLRKVMTPQVHHVLNKYAEFSPFNWADMTRVTSELAKGNMNTTEEETVEIKELKEIFAPHRRCVQKEGLTKACKLEVKVHDTFSDILKTLGLEEYYPSKISLMDAICITKDTKNPTLVNLPWMIIRKILMLDFHARDYLFLALKQTEGKGKADNVEDYDVDDFLLEAQDSSDCEDDAIYLNTLDVLVAIFTCCDNLLKQTVARNMFTCKLAIPFMYPLAPEGKIGMSLWALRTIIIPCHNMNGKFTEKAVPDGNFPVVTFVRLGRPPLSKSKLMNDILRDESHDTFVNHDCNNGTVPRKLMDGLVECSWFISAGREDEQLPCTMMFLNVRGDASFMDEAMEILKKVSSVLFVIATAIDLAKQTYASACQDMLQSGAKVILVLICGNENQTLKEHREERKACVQAIDKKFLSDARIIPSSKSDGKQKNASELKNEARIQLSKAVVDCRSGKRIEEIARQAKRKGIIVDEFCDEACSKGKTLAEQVVKHMKGKSIVECKRTLLPLQGADWLEYSKQMKIQHRPNKMGLLSSSAYKADQVKQEMVRLRERQLKTYCESLADFIKDFISGLINDNQDVVLYFLKWMKIFLDDKSRAKLPQLRSRYNVLRDQLQKTMKRKDKTKISRLKIKVGEAELQLANASLGLENVFREVGQIYEAVKESRNMGKNTREMVGHLPEIAAKLLLRGNPLELVDGDAAAVPISWVSAVLKKLKNILGEKSFFVLSMLGIQSSGKSTLLNTMFGLQFPVSAGRCTRGAYIQLIPVDSKAELSFHYVVVIDTEGLRAPELGQLKHEHDNELATLAIGMGDVTVLNIKGENAAEIKDILQIAVHAFLRMNLVSKNIRDHRTCIFVYQNVPEANAGELMMQGNQKLEEDLDDMVKEAACSENISDVYTFAQIIKFDVQKHIWNFSDLWHGDPPMAPANPGYSKNIDAVKLNLLREIATDQSTFMTTSDLILRLKDLWKGVLSDDFVFSFRNSLEVKAYNDLQYIYYTLEWELQNEMRIWLQTAEVNLKISESSDKLENTFSSLEAEACAVLTKKAEEVKSKLRNYFEKSNLKDIVIQWQQSKLTQLNFAVEQQRFEDKAELYSIKEARRVEILQNQKWSKYEIHIMKKAVELADKLKGNGVSDEELEKAFNEMWIKIVNEFATKSKDDVFRMDLVMDNILYQSLHAHGNILKDELERQPLLQKSEKTSLEGSITLTDIESNHISIKTNLWNTVKKLNPLGKSSKNPEIQAKQKTILLTENILHEINTYLKTLSSRDVKFQKTHAKEVIKTVQEKINTYNKDAQKCDDCTFTILPAYVVKLAVHVSRYCITFFSLMQDEYNKKHGVKLKLEDKKKTAWSLFQNMVKQSTEEVIAGDLFCTEVKRIIEEVVENIVVRNCIDEILRDFQMTKYQLIVKIMDDLACKGNFGEYADYINNAEQFAFKWITHYTFNKIFTIQDESGKTRYAEIANSHMLRIINHVAKTVQCATHAVEKQAGMKMALWIEKFSKRASKEIAVPVSTLKHVGDRHVVDFENLQRIILNQLDQSVQVNLVKKFANAKQFSTSWNSNTPPRQVLDKIWGCREQCPICKEPCADTTSGHYSMFGKSHFCVQHRPNGIGGGRCSKDNITDDTEVRKGQLAHETCNFSVTRKNLFFSCKYCNFECKKNGNCTTNEIEPTHRFQEYKTYLPSWDIAPDPTNNVSKYWMWFMATYQNQLKDMYEAQLPNLPELWTSITRDDALKDLRKVHN